MLQAFSWMFKSKDFANHFCKLSLFSLILYPIGIAFILIIKALFPYINTEIYNYIKIISFGLPFLLIQGYFWNLVDEIIKREVDIEANNIYEDKINKFFVISLPSIKPIQLIWRGIASFIASILMYVPYLSLILLSKWSGTYETLSTAFLTCVYLAYYLFFPAFFWNYAKTNSVFGMMDIRKAIYIMGNYTLNYIFVIITLACINFLNFSIDITFINLLQNNFTNITKITLLIIIPVVLWIKYLYMIYVNAFIIGTITPPREW